VPWVHVIALALAIMSIVVHLVHWDVQSCATFQFHTVKTRA